MLKQVPSENITFSQKVVLISEDKNDVTIQTADNQTHRDDIFVGADGTYSAVRQSLYAAMEEKGILPKADKRKMTKDFACLVGTTDPLDPAKYLGLMDPVTRAILVISDDRPYSVSRNTKRLRWKSSNACCLRAIILIKMHITYALSRTHTHAPDTVECIYGSRRPDLLECHPSIERERLGGKSCKGLAMNS